MGESIRAEHLPPREKIHPRGRRSTHEEEDPPARWKGPPCGGKPPSSRGRIRPREGGSACTVADRHARGERIPSRGERIRPRGRGSTHVGEDRSASGGTTLEGGNPPAKRRFCPQRGSAREGSSLDSGNAQFKLLKNVRSHVGVMIHSWA